MRYHRSFPLMTQSSSMSKIRQQFRSLAAFFPEIELPVTLSAETHHVFSKENKPLPLGLIATFLSNDHEQDQDGYTEYVACFQLPTQSHWQALVYWRAGLMEYEYILTTFEKNGKRISSKVIAGTKSNGETILTRIATIDEEGLITIAEGITNTAERHYNAKDSHTYQLELTATGDILHSLKDH